jgi:hypothetical protein
MRWKAHSPSTRSSRCQLPGNAAEFSASSWLVIKTLSVCANERRLQNLCRRRATCDTERWSWRYDRLRNLARGCVGLATVGA